MTKFYVPNNDNSHFFLKALFLQEIFRDNHTIWHVFKKMLQKYVVFYFIHSFYYTVRYVTDFFSKPNCIRKRCQLKLSSTALNILT